MGDHGRCISWMGWSEGAAAVFGLGGAKLTGDSAWEL